MNKSSDEAIPEGAWSIWDLEQSLPIQDTFWLRTTVNNPTDRNLTHVLYLDVLQDVSIYKKNKEGLFNVPLKAGTNLPLSQLPLPTGLILHGRGNSAQINLVFEPGDQDVYLYVKNPVFQNDTFEPYLYDLNHWYTETTSQRSRVFLVQGFVGGALLIISIYHFLIFLIRRDRSFFWYALYTIMLCVAMLLENGVLQSSIFKEWQYNYRIIWETQILSFIPSIVYFFFMRSFINLEKLIPWLDKFIKRFLIIYIPFSLLFDIHYWMTLKVTFFTFAFPIALLLTGFYCVAIIFRKGDRLALYFSLGSLVLYLFVFSNTMISVFVSLGWIQEPTFPRVWLTEAGIILEILIFSLGLGYKSQRQDIESRLEVERLRTKISSDLHDDVGTMLSGLSMQAQVMAHKANDKDKRDLNHISELSRRAMDNMRDTVWAIDSRQDQYENLIDRMRDFAEDTLYANEISYKLETEGLEMEKQILPNVRQQLYLIYKESINNILKHSKATDVMIRFQKSKTHIILTIKDNGVGIPKDRSSGLGLTNIQMRAAKLDGTAHIENENGAKVEIKIPSSS